jgi:hypothetical protein
MTRILWIYADFIQPQRTQSLHKGHKKKAADGSLFSFRLNRDFYDFCDSV